jgi:hypothetical protein
MTYCFLKRLELHVSEVQFIMNFYLHWSLTYESTFLYLLKNYYILTYIVYFSIYNLKYYRYKNF